MGIMKRVVKIIKADVHGIVDQLEDQGLTLKQHLRDMTENLNLKEIRLNGLLESRKQAQQDYDRFSRQTGVLDRDLTVALQKDKEDIARMLIRKVKPLNDLQDEIAAHIQALDEEISNHKALIDQQRFRYEQLKHRSVDFFHKKHIQERRHEIAEASPDSNFGEMSEEEVELEILKRKEALS